MTTDTIFALASGRPPAAIGVIGVSGPQAHAAGKAIAGKLPARAKPHCASSATPGAACCSTTAWSCVSTVPASSTGEDVVEFQIHGGRAVADAVLDA